MGQMPPVFTGTITNPFPQFTQCVEAGNFNTESQYWQLAKAALLGGGIATIYEAAFGLSPACIALAVELAAIAGGMAYCGWWLNDRLVCLPGDPTKTTGPAVDVCAVGMYLPADTPDTTFIPFAVGNLDTDWTMNLVLYGAEPNMLDNILIDQQVAENQLISETQGFNLDAKLGFQGKTGSYTFQGVYTDSNSSLANNSTTITMPVLHSEIEGAGVYEFNNWLNVLFWITIGALIVQEATSSVPIVSTAISIFMAILIFLLAALGFYVSENNQANPSQVPNAGQINFNAPGSPTNPVATVVCVIGTWVYDTAHEGWNEIHPVKYVQAIGGVAPTYYGDIVWNPSWTAMCGMCASATTDTVIAAQSMPNNNWIIHPLLDGCGDYPAATPQTTQ